MASRKKKANEYSLAWFVKDLFQLSKIQAGIKKAVNKIIIKAKPSTPKMTLTFIELNHELVSRN
jgi:hypothetical protein